MLNTIFGGEKKPPLPFKVRKGVLNHIAFAMKGAIVWSKVNNVPIKDAYEKKLAVVNDLLEIQVKKNIPIFTFLALGEKLNPDNLQIIVDSLADFFNTLAEDDFIHKNQIKVAVIGKWYDLPDRLVEAVKNVIDKTRDYEHFFVNFCIYYNGQQEIVDACKLLGRQLIAGKIDVDSINRDVIKENLYSSYYPPPNILINNMNRKTSGLLLWDSMYSRIFYLDKLWPDVTKADILKIIDDYFGQKH